MDESRAARDVRLARGAAGVVTSDQSTVLRSRMNAAQLFVKCLESEGVEIIFGIPGEENLAIMDALLDSPIRFVTTRHEQGAAFMADVYGRLTGKAGVGLSTLRPRPPPPSPPVAHAPPRQTPTPTAPGATPVAAPPGAPPRPARARVNSAAATIAGGRFPVIMAGN